MPTAVLIDSLVEESGPVFAFIPPTYAPTNLRVTKTPNPAGKKVCDCRGVLASFWVQEDILLLSWIPGRVRDGGGGFCGA